MPPKKINWEDTEVILALDLHMQLGRAPGPNHPAVIDLSRFLHKLPLHPPEDRLPTFRNPVGVNNKLANLAYIHTGHGFSNHSQADARVYARYAMAPQLLKATASAIRSAATSGLVTPITTDNEPDEEAPEGRLLTRWHTSYERNARLTQRKKEQTYNQTGRLACEVCDLDFSERYGSHGHGYAECHHIIPLHKTGQTRNRLADLAIVCANCHRMLHRGDPRPTITQLANRLTRASITA